MEVVVMNRAKAKKETFRHSAPSTAIISITDIYKEPNLFQHTDWLKFVFRFQFDDVEIKEKNSITPEQANKIAEAVREVEGKVDRIIVHCEAGISRSSGVAAAIMKYLFNDDMAIFNNGKYTPNMTCYRMVLNALNQPLDEEEIQNKEMHNINCWAELFNKSE